MGETKPPAVRSDTLPAPAADPMRLSALRDRLLQDGLEGKPVEALLATFGTGLNAAGIAALRIHLSVRTNNPAFGSLAHRWNRDAGAESQSFPRSSAQREDWLQSPLYHILTHDLAELRQRLDVPEPRFQFPVFDDLRALGATDYVLFKRFFSQNHAVVDAYATVFPEGCMMSVAVDSSVGFSEEDLADIRALLPALLMPLKAFSNRRMAEDIAETYLGRDAGLRVLSGHIVRGSVEKREAVICYFDLSGFTKLSEQLDGDALIAMLNAYFEVAVDIVHTHGGNVLKFMGDGMLAIFDVDACADASLTAIEATAALRDAVNHLNVDRAGQDLPTTGFTLALHRGEVRYGNIGGRTRLDFTVIGPAVNTTARLSAMCAHIDQAIVIGAAVARPCLGIRSDLVSLGQYRLRGVAKRQELFTLD